MATHRKIGFAGNSEDLASYLSQKKRVLMGMMAEANEKEVRKKLKAYVEMLDDILNLNCFHGQVVSMPKLLQEVKAEYHEMKDICEEMQPMVEKLEKEANDAFQRAGKYLANHYEDAYNTLEQEEARAAHDEFQAVQYEWDSYNRRKELLHWLMGIIHDPIGFFKNVTKIKT